MAINYNSQLPYDHPDSYNPHRVFVGQNTSKAKQFPEFFREDYQSFIQFIDLYYQFLDTTYVGNLGGQLDIDRADEIFLDNYSRQYAISMPRFDHISVRQFIQNAKAFYSQKGTVTSLKFLFRIAFNDEIDVSYPGEHILRASDGVWTQDYYLTADNTDRTMVPVAPFDLVFSKNGKTFRYRIDRTESLIETPDNLVRLYIRQRQDISIENDTKAYAGKIDALSCIGTLVRQPSSVKIVDGGQYWNPGVLIKIPGAYKDTHVRVTKVDQSGQIKQTEILEFGHTHTLNQIHHDHPSKSRPSGQYSGIQKTLIGINPYRYRYNCDIYDVVTSVDNKLTGMSGDQTYTENTVAPYSRQEETYFGTQIINLINRENASHYESTAGDTSIARWNNSQAILYLEFDYLVKLKGYYADARGQLSNRHTALQDNIYYQPFQYLIDTRIDYQTFKNYIDLVHPIGTKRFQNLNIEGDVTVTDVFSYDISSSIVYTILMRDGTAQNDSIQKTVLKSLESSSTTTDTVQKYNKKYITDALMVTHAADAEIQDERTAYFDAIYVDAGDVYTYPNSLTLDI